MYGESSLEIMENSKVKLLIDFKVKLVRIMCISLTKFLEFEQQSPSVRKLYCSQLFELAIVSNMKWRHTQMLTLRFVFRWKNCQLMRYRFCIEYRMFTYAFSDHITVE